MLDKVKVFFTILLIIIVVFGVGYSIVKIIISLFEKPVLVTSENISEYIKNENLVTNYSRYYYINDCLNNFIEACNQKKYDELYNLYINDYYDDYTREEVFNKLENLQWTTNTMDQFIEYKLEKVYALEREYLLDITLDGKKLYLIFNTESSKTYDYTWAFVK